jgi:hypothetical protein
MGSEFESGIDQKTTVYGLEYGGTARQTHKK